MQTPTSIPYTVNELKQLFGHTNHQPDVDTNTLWTSDLFQHLITESGFTFFTLTDYTKLKFRLVSPMAEAITGYPHSMFANGGIEFMLSLVHPSEIASLRLIHQQIITFFNALPQSEKQSYSYAYNVSIRKADDSYMQLLCQLGCEQLADDGSLLLGKELFTDITQFNHKDDMKLIIRKQDKASGSQNQIYSYDTATSRHKLTFREKEVSELITQGLSSKKIAEILNLSKHTIDTHRRKIRKKG